MFLVFVLIGPAFAEPDEPWRWIMEIAVVASTAAVYVWGELKSPTIKLGGAAGLMAITLGATPFGSTALAVVPVYAGALAARNGTRRQIVVRLAIITALCLLGLLLSPVAWPYRAFLGFSALMVWYVGMSVREESVLAETADALIAENARIQHLATVTERERIARDLHDVAGQTLTALILRSQLVQRLAGSHPDKAIAEARTIETMSRDLLDDFRVTVSGWQQALISDELERAAAAMGVAGIQLSVEDDRSSGSLAPSIETVLALSLREAVTNVVRHSQASHCQISLHSRDHEVTLAVSDDGIGYQGKPGSGLRGMQERVFAAGGHVELSGSRGTTLRVALPIGAAE